MIEKRWQKMALLVLRRVGLCVGAKPNVPFVRLAKIVLKKCAVEKNKNTEVLALGSAV
ncbi:MAG: hypothetical protein IPJ93_03175 [Bacteroidota bacterium]|nr:MAG: hypothetical protein IPJ93_03175 [Bacteroidota bacterium]